MPDTFTDAVLDQSDENGQISWTFAHALADLHCLTADFLEEYANISKGQRIDAGELLHWLGY
jgi:hypothetical protein